MTLSHLYSNGIKININEVIEDESWSNRGVLPRLTYVPDCVNMYIEVGFAKSYPVDPLRSVYTLNIQEDLGDSKRISI